MITNHLLHTMSHEMTNLDELRDVPFAKMTGSGNDFVFVDGRLVDIPLITSPEVIRAICNRHNGIGADGLVVLDPSDRDGVRTASSNSAPAEPPPAARVLYFNSDGSPADLCGNATLCSTVMSVELGFAAAERMELETPAGLIVSRLSAGEPEIDLPPVSTIAPDISIGLVPGETRSGYAIAGIPHLVILCANAETVDIAARGPTLRRHPATGPAGANVNWVSPLPDGSWRYRTFERGVEGETLACGTGAVATAVLLNAWGMATSPMVIRTSSRRSLTVRLTAVGVELHPSLRGEGRVVFRGRIGALRS